MWFADGCCGFIFCLVRWQRTLKMEETFRTTVKRGGKYCVAGAAGNKSCQNTSYTNGISMHRFPKNEETRRKWTNFVRRHRPNFSPTSTSHLCSAHFAPTSFTRRLDIGIGDGVNLNRTLQSGAFPTEDTVISTAEEKGPTVTPRQRRQVRPLKCHGFLKE